MATSVPGVPAGVAVAAAVSVSPITVAVAVAAPSDVVRVIILCFLRPCIVSVDAAVDSASSGASSGVTSPPEATTLERMLAACSGEIVRVSVAVTGVVRIGWVTVTVTVACATLPAS